MFIVLWPVTAKIKTVELATKSQTNLRSCLQFSFLTPDWLFSWSTITFQKYFNCSWFSWSYRHYVWQQWQQKQQEPHKSDRFNEQKKTTLHMQHTLWCTLCYYCTTMTWKIPNAKFSSRRISLQGSSFTLIWHYKCSGKLSTKFKKVNSF